ncbi:MAG: SGNH/GDSL hydrolase family protein [Acidobacteria bacterium]|nr:SGNH/GDSL hydrolase family protein [Acidobacteriota bacterium]
MKHIILLGDSIFDNKVYVGSGKSTIENLREQMPEGWKAALLAVDGNVTNHVPGQLRNLPDDATHLFVSVGGNDALGEMSILQMPARSGVDVFNALSDVSERFEHNYSKMLDAVLALNKPTAVCTIYYPRFDEPVVQKLAVAALATFNDVIIRQAFLRKLPLIDLRYVCDEYGDYANAIEPSVSGGAKIAKMILRLIGEHSFEARPASAYL